MFENEVLLRKVLRTYRNALVETVRVRLNAALGGAALDELANLFLKKDDKGVTRWESLKRNAVLARVSPEIDTVVEDDFELLGVADFYPIFEKFYDPLFPDWIGADNDKKKEHKAGVLRCMRQIKVVRDPTSHEVTQDVGRDEFFLAASNAIIVLKACGCDRDADDIRSILLAAAANKPDYSVAMIIEEGADQASSQAVSRRLSAQGIRVAQYSVSFVDPSADGSELPPKLPDHANIVPLLDHVPTPGSPAAQMLKDAAKLRNVVPVLTASCDQTHWPAFANSVGLTSSARVMLHPEYLSEGSGRLIERLQPEAKTVARSGFSASVPVARAVSDNQLRARLTDQLRQDELRAVWLVSPFASNVSNWTVHVRSLVTVLGQLHQRGVKVTLITRPPSKSEGYEEKKEFLGKLARNGIQVLLHEYLHAKIYLFEATAGRLRWFVGSHNLTSSGLNRWKEVSMEGYREAEYRQAENAMIKIRDHRLTKSFDIWGAQEGARQGV